MTLQVDNDLLLRSYLMDDSEQLFDAVSRNRAHLSPWLNWVGKTTKVEHSRQFIEQSLQQQKESVAMGIFYENKLIGGIGMHQWDRDIKRAQVGYWLDKTYEGKGIMHKSLEYFISMLFEKIGLNKIEIHFVPGNKRSARVAEKLGFRMEGVIRQGILWNGMLEDIVVTGLLRTEWRSVASNGITT